MNYNGMRHLDALIAERVFNQKVSWDDSLVAIPGIGVMGQKYTPHIPYGEGGMTPVPLYSSRPNDMWLLLDEIKKKYERVRLDFKRRDASEYVMLIAYNHDDGPEIIAEAANAPLAVCRAAIKIWDIDFTWETNEKA